MLDSSIINGRSARTAFFILFVGGLYFLISALLANFCNTVIFGVIHIPCISTLEASGLIAFLFIIYFGIKFGLKMNNLSSVTKTSNSKSSVSNYQNESATYSDENKNEIRNENDANNLVPNFNNSNQYANSNIKVDITDNNQENSTLQESTQTSNKKENFFTKNQSKCLENIEKMTEEQKKQLQLTLAKNYGIQIKKEKEFV